MAHGSAGDDNPVALNVAPMVDIIFCLCIFFMCSFHFKQLEGKFESWLPKKGKDGPPPFIHLEEVRVFMTWDAASCSVIRRVGSTVVSSDEEMVSLVRGALERHARAGNPEAPAIVDARADVPWKDVIKVLDLCKANRIDKVELAEPMPR